MPNLVATVTGVPLAFPQVGQLEAGKEFIADAETAQGLIAAKLATVVSESKVARSAKEQEVKPWR